MEAFSFAYTDEAPSVVPPLFERKERIQAPMAFQPITGSASSPGSGVFPMLVFVQGNDQRMMNLDHTPFTVGRMSHRTSVQQPSPEICSQPPYVMHLRRRMARTG